MRVLYCTCLYYHSRKSLNFIKWMTKSMDFQATDYVRQELPTIPEDSTSADMRTDIPVIPSIVNPKKEPDVVYSSLQ